MNYKHFKQFCRNPDYYEMIKEPIDLNTIEKNILTGQYTNVEDFEKDFLKLFDNVEVNCSYRVSDGIFRHILL